ncbi:MAG: VWA domain-containing protein, partial [Pseudomonadota bacterium]
MFTPLFEGLRAEGVKVSIREYLTLLEAMERGLAGTDIDTFYHLSRATLVKDETKYDAFDRVFARVFKGLEALSKATGAVEETDLPEEWLRQLADRMFTDEEKAEIEALGGFEKLMETLKERLKEQQGRHQGGNKWIGTGGTSPYGAYGYNPAGIRIGQHESRHRRAVKEMVSAMSSSSSAPVRANRRSLRMAMR